MQIDRYKSIKFPFVSVIVIIKDFNVSFHIVCSIIIATCRSNGCKNVLYIFIVNNNVASSFSHNRVFDCFISTDCFFFCALPTSAKGNQSDCD